jgi:hypothetical protein
MSDISKGKAALLVLGGVILGIVISRSMLGGPRIYGPGPFWGAIGVPELMVMIPILLWLAFWVLLIGVLYNLGWKRRTGVYAGRIEDLPADFDDWHRRAHERMREAASADDSGRRG